MFYGITKKKSGLKEGQMDGKTEVQVFNIRLFPRQVKNKKQ